MTPLVWILIFGLVNAENSFLVRVVTHGNSSEIARLGAIVDDELHARGINGIVDGIRISQCDHPRIGDANVLTIKSADGDWNFRKAVKLALRRANGSEQMVLLADYNQGETSPNSVIWDGTNIALLVTLLLMGLIVMAVGIFLVLQIHKKDENRRAYRYLLEERYSQMSTRSQTTLRAIGGHSPVVRVMEPSVLDALDLQVYNAGNIRRSPKTFDEQIPVTPENFKQSMDALVDFSLDYMENAHKYNVSTGQKPGFLWKKLPSEGPLVPETFKAILDDVYRVILPGLTHWQHPRFHAYFMAGRSFPDILAETLTSCFAIGSFSWESCPAATELEIAMVNWCGRAIGLPECFLYSSEPSHTSLGGGVIQPTSSDAIFVAVLAARHKKVAEEVAKLKNASVEHREEAEAEILGRLVAYASQEAHSSIEKACKMAMVRIRAIPTDEKFAMRAEALEEQIKSDLQKGLIPFHVHATCGTTSLVSFDNIEEFGQIAARYGMWMHVDGAYGGAAWVCEEFRYLAKGIELAHSVNISCHKFFLQSPALSYFWTRDQGSMRKAFQVAKEVFGAEKTNFCEWGVQTSRRSKALKTWFVMQMYGVNGLKAYIRRIVRQTAIFHEYLRNDERLEVVGEPILGLVCFKMKASTTEQANRMTSRLCEFINRSRKILITHANPRGIDVVRIAVNSERSVDADIRESWTILDNLIDQFIEAETEFSTIENQHKMDGAILGYVTPENSSKSNVSSTQSLHSEHSQSLFSSQEPPSEAS